MARSCSLVRDVVALHLKRLLNSIQRAEERASNNLSDENEEEEKTRELYLVATHPCKRAVERTAPAIFK
eukprot:768511-Hanusia_phi.AAC.8